MTPAKCREHEYRPGEFADGPRYTKALIDSRTCIRCQFLALRAHIVYFFLKGRS
jgi:hypothetical protein